MCQDGHPEICKKSMPICVDLVSGWGEIWQFGFSQESGGAGIHPGGFALMSGAKNLMLSLFGPFGGQFAPIFLYYPIIWGFPLGPLLAPIGSYWPYWLLLAPIGCMAGKKASVTQ